jgi:phosphoglycerol transferase MdoB-like AlkP superfamily enzyme
MSKGLRRFLIGLAMALAALILAAIFVAYQMPELLIDWANLRYCA